MIPSFWKVFSSAAFSIREVCTWLPRRFRKLAESQICQRVALCAGGQGNQNLFHVKTRIATAQILYLQLLNRLNDIRGNQKYLLVNACQSFNALISRAEQAPIRSLVLPVSRVPSEARWLRLCVRSPRRGPGLPVRPFDL